MANGFPDIQLCVCVCVCVCFLAIIRQINICILGQDTWQMSLNVTLLADLCLSGFQEGGRQMQEWLNQTPCIYFAANQWKSRLLLACTAGEQEPRLLGFSLQPEPDCPFTTNNKQARINRMICRQNRFSMNIFGITF